MHINHVPKEPNCWLQTDETYDTERFERCVFVYIEVGHTAQKVYLQAESSRLGTCTIGAFEDYNVREVLVLLADEEPLYLVLIGYYVGKI